MSSSASTFRLGRAKIDSQIPGFLDCFSHEKTAVHINSYRVQISDHVDIGSFERYI